MGRGITPFERRVYEVVRRIPAGRVATYASVAAAAGCRCCRAVGQALARNPFAPDVPCHRVIASDLTPGGFRGARGGEAAARKVRLLADEGVLFAGGRLANAGDLIVPAPPRGSGGGVSSESARGQRSVPEASILLTSALWVAGGARFGASRHSRTRRIANLTAMP